MRGGGWPRREVGEGAEGWVEREDFIRPPPLLDKTFEHNTVAKGKRIAVFS